MIYDAQVTGEMIASGNGEDSAALLWWDGNDADGVILTPHAQKLWDEVGELEV